jgi:16S rRNA G966 N2-methylase RsmD
MSENSMAKSCYIPDFKTPIGWDEKDFKESFKTENSHFVTLEKFDWNGTVSSIENRLILSDNLAIMRSLPSESIDLIYIDPPFFQAETTNAFFLTVTKFEHLVTFGMAACRLIWRG